MAKRTMSADPENLVPRGDNLRKSNNMQRRIDQTQMPSSSQIPIFIDTSMGTHLAMVVSPDTTAGDFKRNFEREHFNCFPSMGKIKIYGLMVKQKSCFYHLPNSMPVRYAFPGVKGTWFLRVEASAPVSFSRSGLSECVAAGARGCDSNASSVTGSKECIEHTRRPAEKYGKRKAERRCKGEVGLVKAIERVPLTTRLSKIDIKNDTWKRENIFKKNHLLECGTNRTEKKCIDVNNESPGCHFVEKRFEVFASLSGGESKELDGNCLLVKTSSNNSTEAISVTSIINRYFSNHSELNRHSSPSNTDATSRATKTQSDDQLRPKKDEKCSSLPAKVVTASAPITAKTRRRMPRRIPKTSHRNLKVKTKGSEVGKRLLTASNNLGVSASKQTPTVSLCRYAGGKKFKLGSPVSHLIFELSDRED